uniref:SdrD B-like domain-containing protein n=1 Tax=Nesterenkonia muleiensis TaxID=2282648 RepID=UPI001300A367
MDERVSRSRRQRRKLTPQPSMAQVRRGAAAALTGALALGGSIVAMPAAYAADGEVTGTVFRDFNQNGVFDTGGTVSDEGLGGVTVAAYDSTGEQVGNTVSDSDGSYTLSVSDAETEDLRIEFSDWPDQYQPSGTSTGGTNGTSVQFVQLGDDPVTDVDFALNVPADFTVAEGEPSVSTLIHSAGDPEHSGVNDEPAVVSTPWSVEENSGGGGSMVFPDRTVHATYGQVGSVWGSAFDRSQGDLFVAATYKRMSGLGPQGLGGIYQIQGALDADGEVQTGTLVEWLDVTSLGIDVGQSLEDGDENRALTNDERGLDAPGDDNEDPNAFANAAKVGIGDIAIDEAGERLYFVNLFDNTVYGVEIASGELAGSWAIPTGANQQAWALQIHHGELYVGWNDTGTEGFQSAADAGLQYHVAKADLADLDAGFETVLDGGNLGYSKGDPVYRWGGTSGTQVADSNPQVIQWNTWTDVWSAGDNSVAFTSGWGNTHVYPQPVLSSLAFDSGGYLTLGFQDRTSIQGGNRNRAADGSSLGTGQNALYFQTVASGDLLIAGPGEDGTFVTESGGVVSNEITGDSRSAVTEGRTPISPSLADGGEGPGGDEFYFDRQDATNPERVNTNHLEVGLGAVIAVPGASEIASTAMDPLEDVRVTGLTWFNSADGNLARGYNHVRDTGDGNNSANFQKGGGLGGVSLLTEEAPVEIGNRVWFDADRDGIQGADEPGLPGVTVRLLDDNGEQIADTVTDENGEYYFRTNEIDDFYTRGDYTVVFERPDEGTIDLGGEIGEVNWADLELTLQESGDNTAIDSNPDPDTGRADVTVNGPGHNDHTIDAGYTLPAPTGDFKVKKNVEGSDELLEDISWPEHPFTVEYTFELDGEEETLSFEVINGGVWFRSEQLPVGTVVTLEEVNFPDIDGVVWGDPEFSSDSFEIGTGKDSTKKITLTNFAEPEPEEPSVSIIKGDGNTEDGVINDANTEEEAVQYEAGEPRDILIEVVNTGPEDLVEVELTDQTIAGDAAIEDLEWFFPDGSSVEASFDEATLTWIAQWDATFLDPEDEDAAVWVVDDVITGVATLTLPAGGELHTNVASVNAAGAGTGIPVEDEDPYNAVPPDPTYAIGDYVWVDANNDGLQD